MLLFFFFFFQAEDGIRDLVRSRGLGDVYKRQLQRVHFQFFLHEQHYNFYFHLYLLDVNDIDKLNHCLLYTSDAADERSSVDLGGRRIIKKKKKDTHIEGDHHKYKMKQYIAETYT